MNRKQLRRTLYDLPGITVIVPEQIDRIPLILKVKSMDDFSGFNFPDGSKVIRQIANIALYKNGEPATHFDPPIELRVAYNFDDAIKAGCNIDGLKLAYWNGSAWVIFEDDKNCEYYTLPPSTAQVAEVKLREWVGDPPLAWGG